MVPTPDAPTRKDAVRNRARLVEAAARAFRAEGLGVSVNAIAQEAGVNVATLYRHFPTKEHLVVAVLAQVLEPLAAARDRALALEGTGRALAEFVRGAARLQVEHRGLVDALGATAGGAEARRSLRDAAVEIVAPLVDRAHRDGELRADLGALDVLIALRMVAAVVGTPGLEGRADRYVDVVLRGLRPD